MRAIYPSLISADLLNLELVLKEFNPLVPGYHLDIMDNNFVPNLTWGPQFMQAIARKTTKQLWVHLMVDDPLKMIDMLELPANSIVGFHIESTNKIEETIIRIKGKKCLPGMVIKPKTPVADIESYLAMIYQVNVMSVEPGFSGQQFLLEVLPKIGELATIRTEQGINYKIAVDGGVNENNIAELQSLGVDRYAIASAIFSKSDPIEAYKKLCE